MKRIILACAIVALMTPTYVLAADGSGSGLALDQMWAAQRADQQRQESVFKAAEGGTSMAAVPVEKITDVRKRKPAASK
jgi:hypothetical protein